jgi:hypothetical protein
MHTFMKYWVSSDNGAPPLNMARMLLPSISFVFLKINLAIKKDYGYTNTIVIMYYNSYNVL